MNHERLRLSLFACVWADLEVNRNTKAILRVGRGLIYDIEMVRTCSAPVSVLRKYKGPILERKSQRPSVTNNFALCLRLRLPFRG